MPFTVCCAICDSRFLLGDDLYQRKVSGRVVTVKCRTCNAAISVDATEPSALPGQRQSRRARRVPPRPKHKEGEPGTATPLPDSAVISADSESDSEDDELDRHPPRSTRATRAEFIDDIEEVAPSSSGTPSLESLINESAPKKPTDPGETIEFLVAHVNADQLGAPTIDVTAFAREQTDFADRELTPRAFEALNANDGVGLSLAPSHLDLPVEVEIPRPSRARNYLPNSELETRVEPPASRRRRFGVAVFALVAVAASVLAVVGIRGRTLTYSADEVRGTERAPAEAARTEPAAQALPVSDPPISALTVTPVSASPNQPAARTLANLIEPASGSKAVAETPKRPASPTHAASGSGALRVPTESATPAETLAEPASEATPEPALPDADFDRSAAIAALQGAAGQAAACRREGDPSGIANLMITFAPSGRVTTANVQGPPYAGTATGGCIATAMRHAQVPAFAGERVTVSKQIVIE